MTIPTPTKNATSVPRTELLFLAAAIVFGAIVRLSFLNRIAVEHFDEGVYASNFWFSAQENFSYPARYLYAPPLLPAAIEWTMTIASACGFKPTGFVPMIPSLLAGIAMIPSIWWVGRRWFGPSAGLISAWLVATSDFHASYSRAALTDVPLCLFILWAVYFIWCAWPDQSLPASERKKLKASPAAPLLWRSLILAGVFTGLAWSTKYNGWLPLAIGGAGGALWFVVSVPTDRAIHQILTRGLIVTTIAFLVWSPVLVGLEKVGGYAVVAANHRQYLVSVNKWLSTASRQVECVGMYENGFGMITEPMLGAFRRQHDLKDVGHNSHSENLDSRLGSAAGETLQGASTDEVKPVASPLSLLLNHVAVLVTPFAMFLAAISAAFFSLRRTANRRSRIAGCLLVAWLLGMSVATPFYHPYPRLVFPWLTAVWLGVGLAVQLWQQRAAIKTGGPATAESWTVARFEHVFVAWFAVNCSVRLMGGTAHAWCDRTSITVVSENLSNRIADLLGSESTAKNGSIVQVWGEPALFFGLRAHNFINVYPSQGLDIIGRPLPAPTFIAFGQQSIESLEFSKSRSKLNQCRLVEHCRFPPSHLVEMDSRNSSRFYAPQFSDTVRSSIEADATVEERDSAAPFARSPSDSPGIWLYRVETK